MGVSPKIGRLTIYGGELTGMNFTFIYLEDYSMEQCHHSLVQ